MESANHLGRAILVWTGDPTMSDPEEREPTREEVDRMQGPVVLEFGTAW